MRRQCYAVTGKMSRSQSSHVGRSRALEKSSSGERSSKWEGPEAGRNCPFKDCLVCVIPDLLEQRENTER